MPVVRRPHSCMGWRPYWTSLEYPKVEESSSVPRTQPHCNFVCRRLNREAGGAFRCGGSCGRCPSQVGEGRCSCLVCDRQLQGNDFMTASVSHGSVADPCAARSSARYWPHSGEPARPNLRPLRAASTSASCVRRHRSFRRIRAAATAAIACIDSSGPGLIGALPQITY